MSLATVDDLKLVLRNEDGRFSVGSGQQDSMTTADAVSYLAYALDTLKIKYQDDIDIDGLSTGTWIRSILIRMQCYYVMKTINTTEIGDTDPIQKAIDDLHKQLYKQQNRATPVKCGAFVPKY